MLRFSRSCAASYLLARALDPRGNGGEDLVEFESPSKDLGQPRIDTGDWAAVREFLDVEIYPRVEWNTSAGGSSVDLSDPLVLKRWAYDDDPDA